MDGSESKTEVSATPAAPASTAREQDAIYQNNKIVARVVNCEVDMEAKELRIGEINQSDLLMIPEECEYQNFRILVQRIAYATNVDKTALHKGRILRGVTADILGYREQ